MQRTCRGGRQERAPQYLKAHHQKQPTLDTADKGKGGAAEPSLVGVAFFLLLFLSRSRPRHDLLFEIRVDSCKPPSRFHLQQMRHGHSSLDGSEETVVMCDRALYHIWTCKEEKPQPWSASICLPMQQKHPECAPGKKPEQPKTRHQPALPLAQLCISQPSANPRTFLRTSDLKLIKGRMED